MRWWKPKGAGGVREAHMLLWGRGAGPCRGPVQVGWSWDSGLWQGSCLREGSLSPPQAVQFQPVKSPRFSDEF